MGFFREWVLHNWGLKLLALTLSFLLWTTYTAEPVVEVGYQVPLEFVNLPNDLELSGDLLTQVHVRLHGRAALLRRLSRADLAVMVDLNGRPAGETHVRLTKEQVTVPYGTTVERISPSQVRVLLVPRRASP